MSSIEYNVSDELNLRHLKGFRGHMMSFSFELIELIELTRLSLNGSPIELNPRLGL